ncbi:hypothetical protein LOZ58_004540 [Ophidiomyces ophidiicola]|nr:hypothetical protein LOZ58_004540 [Ophidiomyces ophidiicola]
MFEKQVLFVELFAYIVRISYDILSRAAKQSLRRRLQKSPEATTPEQARYIIIIGASFAGYHAARIIANSLPLNSPYKVVIIEPNSHFQFTWVLPRFCVVSGHEHKAFIPYGPYLGKAAESVQWIHQRVQSIEQKCVVLQNGEEVPYEFLVVATGSSQDGQLPSRVGTESKLGGIKRLQDMQRRIKEGKKIVVVGGGAAGVELAADAKEKYPEKKVVLVHSRDGLMHRFGPELQAAALKGLEKLGVEVILKDRVVHEASKEGHVVLTSGRQIECDCLVNCIGQKPASHVLAQLSPEAISESGHILVKSTLQVADVNLPRVYACGDVALTGLRNDNARTAMHQATVVGDNIVRAATGKEPNIIYRPHWADGLIKLTLGLTESVTHFGNGKTELLFSGKEKDLALMAGGAWKNMGVKPFEDPDMEFAGKC